jgi:hypothetical protein
MSKMQQKLYMYRGRPIPVNKPACHLSEASDVPGSNYVDLSYEYSPSRIDRFIVIYNHVIYNVILLTTLIVLILLLVRHTTLFSFCY